MADLTKKIIFIVLYWISGIRLISAKVHKYCEWNLCTEDEECCGQNKCCPKSNASETLYVLAWVLAGLIIILTCGGLLKYRKHILRLRNQPSDKTPFFSSQFVL